MTDSLFCLTSELHKKNICNGFSRLQKNNEFVDMTLAADGHLVQVHQNIIALSSPYLKEMLKTAQCKHPVIFLSDVSHEVLCYILEYIYTGEVKISYNIFNLFVKAAKALHISGISSMAPMNTSAKTKTTVRDESTVRQSIQRPVSQSTSSNVAASIVINSSDTNNYNLEVQTYSTNEIVAHYPLNNTNEIQNVQIHEPSEVNSNLISGQLDNSIENLQNSEYGQNNQTTQENANTVNDMHMANEVYNMPRNIPDVSEANDALKSELKPLFSVSNRGSLQMILNRYIYYAHHQSSGGRKCRWRCLEYRKLHCKAFIDTLNQVIVDRKFNHVHKFHDEKIFKKMKAKKIYTSTKEAEDVVRKGNEAPAFYVDSD